MANKFSVNFNGYDITEYLRVTTLDRGIQTGKIPRTLSRRNKTGVEFLGSDSYSYFIPMGFRLNEDLIEKRRTLSKILNVTEPKPLIFSDEPGVVYYAIPFGNIDVAERSFTGQGTIEWLIPEGVGYSVEEYEFTNESGGSREDFIIVDNPGSGTMDLELQATFYSDNGFLGIEDEDGKVSALFGSIEEVDGIDYQVSELLFNDHMHQERGWTLNDGVVPPVVGNEKQQGTIGYKLEAAGEGFAYPTSYGTAATAWTGPSLTKAIPQASNGTYPTNWTASFRTDFNPDGATGGRAGNVGHQSITFFDQNRNIIVSIVIEDNKPATEQSDLAIYIKNKRVYDSRNTNSYYVTARPRESNHIQVTKIGNKIEVELAFIGKKLTFDFPGTNEELRGATFYAARYKSNTPMNNNLIRALNVVAHKVDKWDDIPNKFMDGDELKYGQQGRNVFATVNDMNELRLRDVGSTLIKADPGKTAIHIAYSSFAETPRVILKGRAEYL